MNDFCMYCVGGVKEEIRKCDDNNCPFYRDRRMNMEWQNHKKGVK